MKTFDIENAIIRQEISSRGGGIEISCESLGGYYEDVTMTAYQNYLGGGMLGAVCGDCNLREWESDKKLVELNEELKGFFHSVTNPNREEWENQTSMENQGMPESAY